jgi:GNAT superfamily N-acetyltransferase
MPQVQTYTYREFPSDLNWQAVSFMRVAWPFIEGGALRKTYPDECDPIHFVAVEDGLLLSYAAVIRMGIGHVGEEYETCGLGSVFTFPSSRGRGYGRQVVDAATRYITASAADVAALFTGPDLEGFYARSGWEALQGAITLIGRKDAPSVIDAVRMMLFVSEKGKAGRGAFESHPLYVENGWSVIVRYHGDE